MPPFVDRRFITKSGRSSARNLRSRVRVSLRLEILETRCLMSAWDASVNEPAPSNQHPDDTSRPNHYQPALSSRANLGSSLAADFSGAKQGPGDQSSDAGTTGPLGGDAPSPSGQSPAQVPYVVVAETSSPHQTLRSAQKLPDLFYFGVVGTIGNRDGIDLYQLTLQTGAGRLDFSLASSQSGRAVPLQFELFDGSGRALGTWTSGVQGSDLHTELTNLPAGVTFYLGVSAANASGSGASGQAIDYQLWIDHEAGPGGPSANTTAPTAEAATGITPVTGSAISPSTGLGAAPPGADAQANPSTAQGPATGVLVAVGSASVRSARPSGGLLSDVDPTPPAARDFNAAVNKEWDERSSNGPAPREGIEPPPAVLAASENEPDALVVVHGPGGFPLVGAVAIGHRRRSPAAEVGDFATSQAIGEPVPEMPTGFETRILVARSDNLPTESSETAFFPALSARDLAEYPVSVYSGLGLAMVFTLNAVFSQPMAGFDYLSSRHDADDRSQSNWNDRRRKRARPV
jgi:hypothetical protein